MGHVSRRRVASVAAAAVLAVTALGGCGGEADDGSLHVTLANHPWGDAILERLPEFEQETGIRVEVSRGTADQVSQRHTVQLNAGSTDLDVFMYRPLQEGVQYQRNGWLADLTDRVTADADYAFDDFQEAALDTVTADDRVYGIPTVTERELLFYRPSLFEEAGVEVPETFEELEEAAAALDDDDAGVYGFAARGQRAAAVTQFSGFLYSYGGDFVVDGRAAVASPEAVEAYELYGRLLREHGPLGVQNMSTEQLVPLFSQGRIAMYVDAEVFRANFVDPSISTVVDDVGVAPLPAGPAGSRPYNVASWGIAMNAYTEKADAAYDFVRWATSPEMVEELQRSGVFGARQSVWDDPTTLEDLPQDFADALRASTEVGVGYDRPQVVRVSRARDLVGEPIVAAIQGRDVQEAADDAARQLDDFLEEERDAYADEG